MNLNSDQWKPVWLNVWGRKHTANTKNCKRFVLRYITRKQRNILNSQVIAIQLKGNLISKKRMIFSASSEIQYLKFDKKFVTMEQYCMEIDEFYKIKSTF